MKIIFICGSLEFAKDGVADYTIEVAKKLVAQNCCIEIISVHDRYIQNLYTEIVQKGDNTITLTRLPSVDSWLKRLGTLKEKINFFQPDWISLQYVPYSFHPKGLPYQLIRTLHNIQTKAKWHIMFHETWIGISRISPLKHKITGFLQREIAKSLVRNLRPTLITTSNVLYQEVLSKAGIHSQVLPLFSNIPVAKRDPAFLAGVLKQLNILNDDVNQWILSGIFGNLYPGANLEKALEDLYYRSKTEEKQMAFVSFGRINEGGIAEFKRLEEQFKTRIRFLYLGEQSADQVSNLFQLLNFGISCTPVQHIGKSGVYAAMKLHNLPVLLPAYEYLPEYDVLIKKNQVSLEKREAYEWSVDHVTSLFIQMLSHPTTN